MAALLVALACSVAGTFHPVAAQDQPPPLLLSQIFPGSGAGAPWAADFLVLFNAGDALIPLDGWQVKASVPGSPLRSPLALSGEVAAGGRLLIALRAGEGTALPAADFTWDIDLAVDAGTLLVVSPDGDVSDLVGYGVAVEFSGAPAPQPSNATALHRAGGGCTNSGNNSADFALAPPLPLSSGDGTAPCAPPPLPATATSTPIPADTPAPTQASTQPPATATPPPPATPTPDTRDARLLISEVLPLPVAAAGPVGRYVELVNVGSASVDLAGWQLESQSSIVRLTESTPLEVGAYALLAVNRNPLENGGLHAQALITGLFLSEEDVLTLHAPDGRVVDLVRWGGAADAVARAQPGRSLERTMLTPGGAWAQAWSPWPGSWGDWGSPGRPWQPPPTPTPPLPLLLTEAMIDPAAAPDERGEWVELYNPGGVAVPLAGWGLATENDRTLLPQSAVVLPGAYLVVGASSDPALNGGVGGLLEWNGPLRLPNEGGRLRLLAPGDVLVAQMEWGSAVARPVVSGRSLEWSADDWRVAPLPWPGSAGDAGSPGAPAPPAPTPTPPPTPLPTPTPLPDAWPRLGAPSPLRIDEVAYAGEAGEYFVLVNDSPAPVDLSGWMVTDAARPGDAEAVLLLPPAMLPSGAGYMLARNAFEFSRLYGPLPDAQWESASPDRPMLAPHPTWHRGLLALSDSGDELLLLTPDGQLADAVLVAAGDGSALGVYGGQAARQGESLQRLPGTDGRVVPDQRHRFLVGPASPVLPQRLPAAASPLNLAAALNAPLPDGLIPLVGALGVPSTFSDNNGGLLAGHTPPRLIFARAEAMGLHFVALADAQPHGISLPFASPVSLLPAWRWNRDRETAIVYSGFALDLPDRWALLGAMLNHDLVVQWQGAPGATTEELLEMARTAGGRFVALPADGLLPAALGSRAQEETATPLLPAGNGLALADESASSRFTGLLARSAEPAALLEALRARRGWVTSDPALWVALAGEEGGTTHWMGGALAAANSLPVTLYGSGRGPITLSLVQDGRQIAQTTLSAGGSWRTEVMASPGSSLWAVATQTDGAYAVSAPLLIAASAPGSLLINEALAQPRHDANGDGVIDEGDEFVEIFNPGPLPVSLAGWTLFDANEAGSERGRFVFEDGEAIAGGALRTLWRAETHIALNGQSERLYLMWPGGGFSDEVAWTDVPDDGLAVARVNGTWGARQPASPGRANGDHTQSAEPASGQNLNPSALAGQPVEVAPAPLLVEAGRSAGVNLALPEEASLVTSYGRSVAAARSADVGARLTVQGWVTMPPGLMHGSFYLVDDAGNGLRVYLPLIEPPALALGDLVRVDGQVALFRGETELRLANPAAIERLGEAAAQEPVAISPAAVGEAFEGRLVTLLGAVVRVDDDSIYLADLGTPAAPPLRVHVLRSLGWPRPAASPGEVWRATGVVSQLEGRTPGGGYRLLVRYESDLGRIQVE